MEGERVLHFVVPYHPTLPFRGLTSFANEERFNALGCYSVLRDRLDLFKSVDRNQLLPGSV